MIAYGIGILPLINNLKREIPNVTQPWYSDNAGSLVAFARIETYFYSLTWNGPGRRYYLESSNSVLILHPENIKAGKEFGARQIFKVFPSAHYLGGSIGDDKSKSDWQREHTLTWHNQRNRREISPGELFRSDMCNPIRVNISTTHHLVHRGCISGSRENYSETFLPRLFFWNTKTLSPIVGTLSMMPIKVARLGLLNPVKS